MGALVGLQALGSQYSVPSSSGYTGQGPSSLIRQTCPLLADSSPARLEQGSLGHCLQSWVPLPFSLTRPWETGHASAPVVFPAFSLSPTPSHPLTGLTNLGSIPVPLQASCMTSDRWLNLSDSSFLILEVKLLTPPSVSWGGAC